MKTKLLISLVLFSGLTFGVERKRMPEDLAHSRGQVMELGARLTSLEKEISAKNNLYLSSLEQIKQFEADVQVYRDRLLEIRSQLKFTQEENQRILKSYLLESESDSNEAWQKKIHLELLKQAQLKLKAQEEELTSFEAKVGDFNSKLASLKNDEEELSMVIKELESRKKSAMDAYLANVEHKKKIEGQLQAKKLKTKLDEVKKEFSMAPVVESMPDRFFLRPVDDFVTYTASPKGVTFKYNSVQAVKAVGEGKIVFAGDLGSYGQVVLTDHGNDLRTVLLGKMNIKVKKNDTVKNGEVLAYTLKDTTEAQNLYFEVRKKNSAQNTILWLDLN